MLFSWTPRVERLNIGFMIIFKIWFYKKKIGKFKFNDKLIVKLDADVMDAFVLPPHCTGSSSTSKKREKVKS